MRRSPLADAPGFERLDPTARRVVAVVLGGLLARLLLLGDRIAHFDEGRVAWWTDYFVRTGSFEYRYIIHGPLVQHVNAKLFPILGYNDFVMRLVVALVGAALPLVALLFREHLDRDETVAVALFLAFNPVILYYSRFFRSTLLVAAFSFTAFALLVRAYDERAARYVHGAVVFVALAFAAKENAVVYLLTWIGASGLLLDHALFRIGDDRSGIDWLRARAAGVRDRFDDHRAALPRYVGHVALAVGLFVLVSLYFYAPRTPDSEAVGLWSALASPGQLPDLFGATVDDVVRGYEYWFGGSTDAGEESIVDEYLSFLGQSLRMLSRYALPLALLSVFGFLAERWGSTRRRGLVMFASYCGFVSVLGYPLGTDIYGAWIMVNALVPLAIPAGVGLALVVRWTRGSFAADQIRAGVGVFVLVLVVWQVGAAGAGGVYLNPAADDNGLAQYAQPADDYRSVMATLEGRIDDPGTDILVVGSSYTREPRRTGIEPLCTSISETLPIQWYIAMYDADGACAGSADEAATALRDSNPDVVVAPARLEGALASELDGYASETYRFRTRGAEAVFFYRPDAA